jgi:hypothetical protein
MANRFLNNIKINDSYTLPAADGTADQVITTNGSGQLSFVDQSTLAVDSAETVEVPVKNLQGSALTKGDPVYISGSVGASGILEVQLADAGNAAKMPAVGLLKQDLAANAEGFAVVTGKLRNLVTSPIDGVTPSPNDVIYVKSGGSTGAALTTTKPTGSTNLIQNMGKVGRVSTSSDGTFVVSSILRSNDIPNLPTGKIWVGDGNTTTSTVVHLDEPNGRMGIGTTNPSKKLTLEGGGFSMFADGGTSADVFSVVTHQYSFSDENEDAVYSYDSANGHVFSTGGSTRVNIKQNGNVGIGTPSPSRKLHVGGASSAAIATLQRTNATTTGAFGALQWTASDDHSVASISVVGDGDNEGGHMDFRTTSAAANNDPYSNTNLPVRMRINSSGNVGVGTTDPGQKLEVSDSSATTIRIDNTKNGTWTVGEELGRLEWYGNDASGEGAGVKGYIKLDSDNIYGAGFDMRFGTTDGTNGITERMVITKAGNVGIGTTIPGAKVHSSDNGSVPSIDAGTMFLASNTSATGDYSSMSIMSGTAGIASLFFGDTDAEKRGSVRYLNSTDEMRFRTANTDRVTIKSGGNVGIGTTDPGQKLDVDGYIAAHRFTDSDNASFYLEPGSGATGQWKVQTPSGYVLIGPNNTSWAHFYTDRSNGYYFDKRIVADTGIFGSYNEDLTLQAPYNTTRMTINSSTGNVGINTTNPGYNLDVDGEARIGSTNRESTRLLIQAENTAGARATTTEIRMLGYESRGQGIFFQDSGNSGEEWFAGLNYNGSWDKYSIGYDASGGQGEYVDNAILTVKGSVARVGVKIHDPRADMDVNGTIRAVGGTFTSGTSGADSNASAGIVLRRGKKLFSGIPNGANEDFYLRSLLEQTTSGEIIIGQGGTSLITDISLKPGSSGNIRFFASGSENMRINSSGNVGIGTTGPASKLEVDGGDIEIDDSDRGLILRAPNGTRYRLQVANDGSLSTTAL